MSEQHSFEEGLILVGTVARDKLGLSEPERALCQQLIEKAQAAIAGYPRENQISIYESINLLADMSKLNHPIFQHGFDSRYSETMFCWRVLVARCAAVA